MIKINNFQANAFVVYKHWTHSFATTETKTFHTFVLFFTFFPTPVIKYLFFYFFFHKSNIFDFYIALEIEINQ